MTPPPGKGFLRDSAGVSAVEFALVLPLMLSILLTGFVICQAVSIKRKLTITTRALADLTTQYPSLTASQMSTIINASTQIIAPYDPTPLNIRISEVQTFGQTTCFSLMPSVIWSTGSNSYAKCSSYPLPTGMNIPNSSYIVSEISYIYKPPFIYNMFGAFTISDRLIMLPRVSSDISYTGP